MQNQSSNKANHSKPNIHKHSRKTVVQEARGSKNRQGRMHMIENRQGSVDLKALKAVLKCGEEGEEVRMTLGIQLFLLLEGTLQCSDLVLEQLLR